MPRLAMVVMAQITIRMILMALRSMGRMVLARVLGWWPLRRPAWGLSACWMAVSITTQSNQVTSSTRPMLLSESLMARAMVFSRANSMTENPQIRPSNSMKEMASTIRNAAWVRLRSSSL
ncbi:hypothetical protein D3C81_1283130 [compost metagenome]